MRVAGLVMMSLLVLTSAEEEALIKKTFVAMRSVLDKEKSTEEERSIIKKAMETCSDELALQENELMEKGKAQRNAKEGGKLVTEIILGCLMKKLYIDKKAETSMARASQKSQKQFTTFSKCANKQGHIRQGAQRLVNYESLGRSIFARNLCGGYYLEDIFA